MKLSDATYLQRFNTTVKSDDETFVAYASRLQGLLSYYLDSRKVRKFDELRELLLCDRLKSVLSENCLKYVLSIESGLDKGWLPLKDLTEYVDRFVASKGDSVKPKAFAIGQTPTKLFKPNNDKFGDKLGVGLAYTPKSGKPLSSPGAAGGNFTPVKQTICYTCQKPGHISRNCPSTKKFGTTSQASAKRVAVMNPRLGSVTDECGGNLVVTRSKSMPDQTQISKVDHSTSIDHDLMEQTPQTPIELREKNIVTDVDVSIEPVDNAGVVNDLSSVEHVASISVSCSPTQLSSLTHVDVRVKSDRNDPGLVIKALSDTGAQISV